MDTRNRVFTALQSGMIHNDHEIAAVTGLTIEDVRYRLKRLEAGGLIDFVKKERFKRKVFHVYTTKQMGLFDKDETDSTHQD